MSQPGRLIVLEGPDGVGKSSLTKALLESLLADGLPCVAIAFPGNEPGTLGRLVYDVHHEPNTLGLGTVTATALQVLHVAAHADAIQTRILPTLASGTWVLMDRYWWSTWVYGSTFGIPEETLNALIALELHCWGSTRPDPAVLIETERPWRTAEVGEVWTQRTERYSQLASRESVVHSVYRVSNNGSFADTLDQLRRVVLGGPTGKGPQSALDRSPRKPNTGEMANRQLSLGIDHDHAATRRTPGRRRTSTESLYDAYWHFAAERQEVFFRRLLGTPPPWTHDPVLTRFKFTNAYRASDRTSQFLIRVIYNGDPSPREVVFRILLFKLFNRIETWGLLEGALGELRDDSFDPDSYNRVLDGAMAAGVRIYSAAYIMPAADRSAQRKHVGHLRLLNRMLKEDLPARLLDSNSMGEAFQLLRSYPMVGDFLAYQYVTDINYSTVLSFSEMEFVVPGPGALRGIEKCFPGTNDRRDPESVIRRACENQVAEFTARGIRFRDLWGRPLQLIDCQNLFCEIDKYSRQAFPHLSGPRDRTRIKQSFSSSGPLSRPWYPPKWGINDRVARDLGGASAAS